MHDIFPFSKGEICMCSTTTSHIHVKILLCKGKTLIPLGHLIIDLELCFRASIKGLLCTALFLWGFSFTVPNHEPTIAYWHFAMHKINLFPLFGFYLYVFSTSKKRELAWQQLWICSITINWIMELEESVDFHCIPVKEKNGDKCLILKAV